MTTIVALRTKKGIYMASDTQVSNEKRVGHIEKKFLRAGYGFLATSGDAYIGSILELLISKASCSFAFMPLEANKQEFEESVKNTFKQIQEEWMNSGIDESVKNGKDFAGFLYIDKARAITGGFNIKIGLFGYVIEMQSERLSHSFSWGTGSGYDAAEKFMVKYNMDHKISNLEFTKRSIHSAIAHDMYSGLEVYIEYLADEDAYPYMPIMPATVYDRKSMSSKALIENVRRFIGANISRVKSLVARRLRHIFLNYDLRDHFIAIVNYAKEY